MDRRLYELQADICQTFTHPKRIEILHLLRDGEKSVGQIADEMGVTSANVSQHLSLLRERGAVTYRREGQTLFYRVAHPEILQACDLMRRVLLANLSDAQRVAEGVGSGGPEQQEQ